MTRCFVIGPIGNKFAPLGTSGRERYEEALDVFEKVIIPACQAHGLEPIRADQIALAGEITEQVFRHLMEDEVVIADVSGGNPNVMYELGLRHTRPLLTLQLGEYGQLPFDVSAIRTIQFSRSERGLIDARKSLEAALEVGLREGADPVTATRVWQGLPAADSDVADEVAELVESTDEAEEVEEDGLIELMASVEEVFPQMSATAENIGATIEEMGAEAVDSNREFDELNASGAPASARLSAVTRFSRRLQAPVDRLTSETEAFVGQIQTIDKSVNGILDFLGDNPELIDEETEEFLDSLAGTARVARETMENLGQFAVTVRGLGAISRSLRRPGAQIEKSINKMSSAAKVMDAWESRVGYIRQMRSETLGKVEEEVHPRGDTGDRDDSAGT